MGRVVDESDNPLPGVNVRIKNARFGVLTDTADIFRIDAKHIAPNFRIFFRQQKKCRKDIPSRAWAGHHSCRRDINTIEEVVVTSYQTMSKRESANAISTISAKEVTVEGAASINQMLQWQIQSFRLCL